jgi:predicted nucleic acid-binding Zn ribbon protein
MATIKLCDTFRPPCPRCGGQDVRKIITLGAGGVHGDEPAWINQELRDVLQADGDRPVTSRTELKRYMQERGIVHKDSGGPNLTMI